MTAPTGTLHSFHPEPVPTCSCGRGASTRAAAVVEDRPPASLPLVPFAAGTSMEGPVAPWPAHLRRCAKMNAIGPSLAEESRLHQCRPEQPARARATGSDPRGACSSPSTRCAMPPSAECRHGGLRHRPRSATAECVENVIALTVYDARGRVVRTTPGSQVVRRLHLTRLNYRLEGTLGAYLRVAAAHPSDPRGHGRRPLRFPSLQAAVQCCVSGQPACDPSARIELVDELQIEPSTARRDRLRVAPSCSGVSTAPRTTRRRTGAGRRPKIAAYTGGAISPGRPTSATVRGSGFPGIEPTRRPGRLRPAAGGLTTDVCGARSSALVRVTIAAAHADIAENGLNRGDRRSRRDGNFHTIVLVDPTTRLRWPL